METKLTLVPTNTLRPEEQQKDKADDGYKAFKSRGKYHGYRRKDDPKNPEYQAQNSPQTNPQPPTQTQEKEVKQVKETVKEQTKPAEKLQQKSVSFEPQDYRQEDYVDSQRFGAYEQQGQPDHKFVCDFPRAKDYSNINTIAQTFPHLKDVNSDALDIDGLKDLRCFIMRSNNEDDIHKAVKYGIWTSTQRSNEFLNKLYEECAPKNIPIFLFYSVVRSGQFVAVGQMVSKVIPKSFQHWWEADKWVNHFQVKWHYVKDLSYKHFSHLYMEDDLPVTRARDCTNVPLEASKEMLQIYRDFAPYNSIFNAFAYMDIREDMLRSYKQSMQAYQRYMTSGEQQPYNAGYAAQANNPAGYQGNPQYFKYNSFPAKPKDSTTGNQGLNKAVLPKKNDMENLFKEFETTHAFYSEEKKKWKQDGEVMKKQGTDPATLAHKYEDLKSREKEILEGLELIESKYQAITEAFQENEGKIAEKDVKEGLNKRIKSLNELLEQFKKDFTKSKDDMFSLYEKGNKTN